MPRNKNIGVASIAIVTSGHLWSNPRVWREADALAEAGYDVDVFGVWLDEAHAELDRRLLKSRQWRYHPTADLRGRSWTAKCRNNWYRVRARLGREAARRGLANPHSLGYAVNRLRDAARRQRADLTILHLQTALWVGTYLHRDGRRIGVDFEDWYSKDNPASHNAHSQREYYRALESRILPVACHATTTSHALADALSAAYQCRKPEVIYNSVRTVPIEPQRTQDGAVRLIWFSQTLGPGRGLEIIFAALPQLTGNWQLELRANASPETVRWVDAQVSAQVRERIRIEPIVAPDELNQVVAQHDIGLASEQTDCRNKDLTVANKILQYLQSGLLVLASETTGQREILGKLPGSGEIYAQGDVNAAAELLNRWINQPEHLMTARRQIFRDANAMFAYERQIPRLLASVERALSY